MFVLVLTKPAITYAVKKEADTVLHEIVSGVQPGIPIRIPPASGAGCLTVEIEA